MVGGTSKETNWTAAFRAAEKHPDGELVNVHGATLRAMENAGVAHRKNGKWYMKGKGPGPVEEPAIEEPKDEAPAEVTYKPQDASMWQIHLDVEGAPDTTHPDQPGGAIRPVGVTLGIGVSGGAWTLGVANVFGLKVKDGKAVTKRNYPLAFVDPLDPDSFAPDWLRKVCREWLDKANGRVKEADFGELLEESSLGAPHAKAATEEIPEAVRRRIEHAIRGRRSPQRASFDMALDVLLIRENLDGAEWAIARLREMSDENGIPGLRVAADELEKALDKRAAELAVGNREN
jgi:hypothetical protein